MLFALPLPHFIIHLKIVFGLANYSKILFD